MRRRLSLSALASSLALMSSLAFVPAASADFESPMGRIAYVTTVNGHKATMYPAHRLELRVWPTGAAPFRDRPQFQATGDAGGKLQIQGRDA